MIFLILKARTVTNKLWEYVAKAKYSRKTESEILSYSDEMKEQ